MLVTSALTEGGCNAQSTGRPFPCLGFRLSACRNRITQSGSRSPGPAGVKRPQCRTIAAATALLDALFGNSPYLTETALQNPSFMADLWRAGPDAALAQLDQDIETVRAEARSGAAPEAVAPRLQTAEAQRRPHRRRRRHRRGLAARTHHRHAEPLRRRPASTPSSRRSCSSSNARETWRSAAIPRPPPSPCSAWASSAPTSSTTRAIST